MQWIKETFGTEKPIIAMCHFQPLPGDLYYDKDGGMQKVVDYARQEFLDLQEGGVDGKGGRACAPRPHRSAERRS